MLSVSQCQFSALAGIKYFAEKVRSNEKLGRLGLFQSTKKTQVGVGLMVGSPPSLCEGKSTVGLRTCVHTSDQLSCKVCSMGIVIPFYTNEKDGSLFLCFSFCGKLLL